MPAARSIGINEPKSSKYLTCRPLAETPCDHVEAAVHKRAIWAGVAAALLAGREVLAGRAGLVEADPVGGGVDELHLPSVSRAWADARIEERISARVEFGVQSVEVAYHDKYGRAWRAVVVVR